MRKSDKNPIRVGTDTFVALFFAETKKKQYQKTTTTKTYFYRLASFYLFKLVFFLSLAHFVVKIAQTLPQFIDKRMECHHNVKLLITYSILFVPIHFVVNNNFVDYRPAHMMMIMMMKNSTYCSYDSWFRFLSLSKWKVNRLTEFQLEVLYAQQQ